MSILEEVGKEGVAFVRKERSFLRRGGGERP